jgi:glycosyltransferase involved in cell wall biosynthesis
MADRTTFHDPPAVSVVMTVYNCEAYLGEAISSILAQTYTNFEFIIVEGGSTDGSAKVLAEFAGGDARIHPVFMPSRCNMSRALNIGVELARGEWIAYMEADNIALPERLSIQMDWMLHGNVEIGGSLAWIFGKENRPFWFPESHEAIRNYLLLCCAMLQTTMLMPAKIAKINLFDEGAVFQDYEMWTRLAPYYRMGNIQQILVKYRRHSQQHSKINAELDRRDLRKFSQRYFHNLFPEATAEDRAAFDRIVAKEPFPNPFELERAGNWLVRLAQTPDNHLRQVMKGHWYAACFHSTHLGLACYRLYCQMTSQFGVALDARTFNRLWIMCALRLKFGSLPKVWLNSISKVIRRAIDSA